MILLLALLACDNKPNEDSGGPDGDGDGYGLSVDCDDDDPGRHPGAVEDCDALDDDCDGLVDEGALVTLHVDADEDGYGDPDNTEEACAPRWGLTEDDSDCDDDDPDSFPGADELCDGADNDCDGEVDEEVGEPPDWYRDDDGDGYGVDEVIGQGCVAPEGGAATNDDCDDDDPAIHPGAEERCDDEMDSDCDGSTNDDDAVDAELFFEDDDGDGYGDPTTEVRACEEGEGAVLNDGDCDDSDPDIHPDAEELCDGADNDCDGQTDGDHRAPEDHATIQEAIAAAEDGDLVCVGPGSWTETLTFGGREVSVVGRDGAAATTLDGGADGPVVRFDSSEGPGARLEGFTVTNGLSDRGAGIYIIETSPTLVDLRITANTCDADEDACYGTGLYAQGGDPSLQDVAITDNLASSAQSNVLGAGAFFWESAAALEGVEVSDNVAIAGSAGEVWGGGLTFWTGSVAELTDCVISGNQAESPLDVEGVGLRSEGATITLTRVTFDSNVGVGEDDAFGGGASFEESVVTVVDSEVRDNSLDATGDDAAGAGFFLTDSDLSLSNTTFTDNSLDAAGSGYGGALYLSGVDSSAASLDELVFSGTVAHAGVDLLGGAVHITTNDAAITGVEITSGEASADDDGYGALYLNDSDGSLANVELAGNTMAVADACNAGGAYLNNVDSDWTNIIVAGNTCESSGGDTLAAGIFNYNGSDGRWENVTVVGNEASGDEVWGSGVTLYSSTGVKWFSATVSGNTTDADATAYGGGLACYSSAEPAKWRYNNVQGNDAADFVNCEDPTGSSGNLSEDPAFTDTSGADPADWDLTLSAGSPLIDAGDPKRSDPDGSVSDIGAWGGPGAADW